MIHVKHIQPINTREMLLLNLTNRFETVDSVRIKLSVQKQHPSAFGISAKLAVCLFERLLNSSNYLVEIHQHDWILYALILLFQSHRWEQERPFVLKFH